MIELIIGFMNSNLCLIYIILQLINFNCRYNFNYRCDFKIVLMVCCTLLQYCKDFGHANKDFCCCCSSKPTLKLKLSLILVWHIHVFWRIVFCRKCALYNHGNRHNHHSHHNHHKPTKPTKPAQPSQHETGCERQQTSNIKTTVLQFKLEAPWRCTILCFLLANCDGII